MKKFLLSLLMLPLFVACGSDDDNDQKANLDFIQVRITSDDVVSPSGNVYLFKVSGYVVEDDKPSASGFEYTPSLRYKSNNEQKYMVPVSSYGSKSKGSLSVNDNRSYSVHSIYWKELSTLYGTPLAGGEYIVYIELNNGTYGKASKRFTISKNSIINVKLSSCKDYPEYVDATWSIEDYK